MKEKLEKLLENAYQPYSKVSVAAIVITKDGTQYKGVNIENAAFPSGICAERTAIFSAIVDGKRKGDFQEIHLTSSTEEPLFPCGACRQVMAEFFEADTLIYIHHDSHNVEITFDKLLPHAVLKESLK